ncbi:MAG: SpoIVB peptidase [Clostridiales bacterium]|nr:SpoIVB peptidase [Clostridiales bacterium]
MKRKIVIILMCLIVLFSQTPLAIKVYDNRNLSLYKNEVSASVFKDYSTNIANDTMSVKVLGITIKNINIKEDKKVYLGGQTVGVAMYTNGLLVTDVIAIEDENGNFITPGKDAGIKKGDYLIKANNIKLDDVSNIDAILNNSKGEKIKLSILRGNTTFETEINPVKSKKDGLFHLGLWMRDSAAGLGTITYIDPETNRYMALGHSICDSDTGQILSVRSGRVVECIITGVKKGEKGKAGELKGTFGINAKQLGTVEDNTKFGILGNNAYLKKGELVTLGSQKSVETGKAYIYSDFENGEIKKYEIEIIHKNEQTYPSEKSMVIKITDKNLIEKTGGIVQGLSGSPIVQNGRLIGAVTHVMINDSTRGYGIFIENMIQISQENSQVKKAS